MAESTELMALTWLYEIGTVGAILLFIYSFYIITKIKQLFPGSNIILKWRVMQLLLILLAVIFIIDWIVWISDNHVIIFILGGIIRLSTAIFIVIVMILFYRTYQLILHKEKPT